MKIALRTYLEEKIKHLEKQIKLYQKLNEKALILKSEENKIHFQTLNGEAERIKEILKSTIPREVHERDMKELFGKIEVLTTSKDINTGKSAMIGIVIIFLLNLVTIAIALLK